MDFSALKKAILADQSPRTDWTSRFLDPTQRMRRYAIGLNEEARQLNALTPLDGVIHDFSNAATWEGIPIVRTPKVPKDATIVNCSTSIAPLNALTNLNKHGLTRVAGINEVILASNGRLRWPEFVTHMRNEIDSYGREWGRIYSALADEESRRTLTDVVSFRLSCDTSLMRNYSVRVQEQYFEDFMRYREEVFVDAGGYDGDTSEAFAHRYPDYRKIILFEPSGKNMALAMERLAGVRDVEFHATGLSDAAGTVGFNQHAGSACAVSANATDMILVETLDAAIADEVSVIKMDLEGWEVKALRGASSHIARTRPKLALAAYHKSADIRQIFNLIGQFRHDYKCYLRHYTQGWSETIMYFV